MNDDQLQRLRSLLEVQSYSRRCDAMIAHMHVELEAAGMTVEERGGQLFAQKGDLSKPVPFYVAHADTVHPIVAPHQYAVNRWYDKGYSEHIWYAYDPSSDNGRERGIGGDDKCGLFVCMEAARALDNVGVIITVDEEIGCVGARRIMAHQLDAAAVLIQADRRGGTEAIRDSAGTILSSAVWQELATPFLKAHKYQWSDYGTITDVQELVSAGTSPVSAVNLSAGYYDPHTTREWISEPELENALALAIVLGQESAGIKWEHRDRWADRFARRTRQTRMWNSAYEDWDEDWDDGTITVWENGEPVIYASFEEFESSREERKANPYYRDGWSWDDDDFDYGDDDIPEEEADWTVTLAKEIAAARGVATRVLGIPNMTAGNWDDSTAFPGDVVTRTSSRPPKKKKGSVLKPTKPTQTVADLLAQDPEFTRVWSKCEVCSVYRYKQPGDGPVCAACQAKQEPTDAEFRELNCQAVGCMERAAVYEERMNCSLCGEHANLVNVLQFLYGQAVPNDVREAMEQFDFDEAKAISLSDKPPIDAQDALEGYQC